MSLGALLQLLIVAIVVGWCLWRAWRTWVRRPPPASSALPGVDKPGCGSGGCDHCAE